MRLVLASASPRRLELLKRIAVIPDEIAPADIDEAPRKNELPAPYARRMAAQKAAAISRPGCLVLAADTVVAAGEGGPSKTEDEGEAREALSLLSGRRHRVHSAVTLVAPDGTARHRLVTTVVSFKRLSQGELDDYLASREYEGKAGGYAIQGRAEALIRWISGSHSAVVGLPLFETRSLLVSAGYEFG